MARETAARLAEDLKRAQDKLAAAEARAEEWAEGAGRALTDAAAEAHALAAQVFTSLTFQLFLFFLSLQREKKL